MLVAWAARDARDAWAAWAARDARDALSIYFAAEKHWITHRKDLLAIGVRDAYYHGAEIILPTGKDEIGYAMAE